MQTVCVGWGERINEREQKAKCQEILAIEHNNLMFMFKNRSQLVLQLTSY